MYTIDEFEMLMNESFPAIVIGGREYGRGTTLRAVDPKQFEIEFHDWMHYLDEME
jgi:hypothetical protein